jgi:hypothetical protein
MIKAGESKEPNQTSRCVLEQEPDGVWYATLHDEQGDHRDQIGGWDHLNDLLDEHDVIWRSPSDLGRFRAQYGEPPATFDVTRMGFDGGS